MCAMGAGPAHWAAKVDISQYNLDMFKRNLKEFLRHFVIVDEIWIHHYTSKTKEQFK